MSIPVTGEQAASKIEQKFPDSAVTFKNTDVWIDVENLTDILSYLKNDPEFDMQFLNLIINKKEYLNQWQ